jgi:RecB family exonuclease
MDAARALFSEVAEPMLSRLSPGDAALERARLFGSALSVGIVDIVLASEIERPGAVRERWLEFRLNGDFSLGDAARRVPLRGVADRIDLLDGNRLRVIDYKTGAAPDRTRALQVAIYALCAQELLTARDGEPWQVEEALYMAFSGKRATSAVVEDGETTRLDAARVRLWDLVDGIARGEFPPRPHDPIMCGYCSYSPVCRKDYVE